MIKIYVKCFKLKARVEVYMKNTIPLSTIRRRQDSREEELHLAWSKHVSSQGVFL